MNRLAMRCMIGVILVLVVVTGVVLMINRSSDSRSELPSRAEVPQRQHKEPQPKATAAQLYQKALLHKDPGDSPQENYKLATDYCPQTLQEYPNSPEAEKARQLWHQLRNQRKEQYTKARVDNTPRRQ